MRDRIAEALKAAEGFVEIRVEKRASTSLSFRRGETEKIAASTDVGGCVRALAEGGGWGFATFNSLAGLDRRVSEAVAASRAVQPPEPITLAGVEPVDLSIRAEITDDPRSRPISEKAALVRSYEEILRGRDGRIIDSSAGYGDSFTTVWYANTDGTAFVRERLDVVTRVGAVCRDGDNVQTAHKSWSSRSGFEVAVGLENEVRSVADIAVGLLEAEQVKAGKHTVVLDPTLAGVFVHEAFGHLSESDHIVENPQAREMMTLGRRFGPEELNITDDGSVRPDLRGSLTVDDEGVRCRKNYLVRDGVLVGRLHNRETAVRLGEPVTGNARAQGYTSPPIIRMTNTAIEQGSVPFDQMISDIKEGVYCIEAYGGQTMMENFSFSAGHAYMIRNGKVAEMVRDVVLQGNLFETLMNVEAIGSDFVWSRSGGQCGKGGQAAPVSFGSPHIRIRDVIVGGQ